MQAVVRLEPDLREKGVAILAGAAPLTKVFATNRQARDLGVETGMTKVQAEAFQGVVWRWRSLSQEASAYAALLDCAWAISPRVEDGPKGAEEDFCDTVVLDLAGCQKLFGAPEKIAHDLKRIASEVGLEANVAVAGNPLAAVCAAQGFLGVTVIPAGDERLQMGRLSLEGLGIPFEFVETLRRWGVGTCKEFAALPEIAIVERLGQEGLRWWRLAQGANAHPLIAKDFPSNFEEHMDLESPVDLLEPLLFVLNRLLEQLFEQPVHSFHRRDQSYPHARTKGLAEEGPYLSCPDTAASGAGARRQAALETLAARSRSAPSVRACRCGLNVDDSGESTFAAARVISAPVSRPGASRNYARANPKHSW